MGIRRTDQHGAENSSVTDNSLLVTHELRFGLNVVAILVEAPNAEFQARLDEFENVSHRAGAIEIWFVEAVMSGAGYRVSSQSRQR